MNAHLNANINLSVYIPRMDTGYNQEMVAEIFRNNGIHGVVSVDFIPMNKKPGFQEIFDTGYVSAFVHIYEPYYDDTFNKKSFQEDYVKRLNTKFWNTLMGGQSYKIYVNKSVYWLCMQNKNPVPRTLMNIHQVAENGRHLEKLIEDKEWLIHSQNQRIEELENNMKNVSDTLYQLIGLLGRQGIQDFHMHAIMNGKHVDKQVFDTSKCEACPTTRQGYCCESRVDLYNPNYRSDYKNEMEQLEKNENKIRFNLKYTYMTPDVRKRAEEALAFTQKTKQETKKRFEALDKAVDKLNDLEIDEESIQTMMETTSNSNELRYYENELKLIQEEKAVILEKFKNA